MAKSSPILSPTPIYEEIGRGYTQSRRADPHWQVLIHRALSDARTVVNVGAGTGSYEPEALEVVAVEPSAVMIQQRSVDAAPVVCAVAEQLPFSNQSFDIALAVLTTHHWSDVRLGLLEMCRVSSAQVIVTWDPAIFSERFWLIRDYLPEIGVREAQLAPLANVLKVLGDATVLTLPVPAECVDGVLGAYWRRPEAYLVQSIRRAMSGIALTETSIVEHAMDQLRADLKSKQWYRRNAELLDLDELDLGYRLVLNRL